MPYKIFGLCIPVEGYLRTVIYDLQTGHYYFVPNGIESYLSTLDDAFIESPVFSMLQKERLIYNIENPDLINLFAPIELMEFEYPSEITNAIVELDAKSDFNLILNTLSKNNCNNIQIHFYKNKQNEYIYFNKVLSSIQNSAIKYCEIVADYYNYKIIIELLKLNPIQEIKFVQFYNSPSKKKYRLKTKLKTIVFESRGEYDYSKNINFKNKDLFLVNTQLFIESKKYNNYYYRKLYINRFGVIKNGPLANEEFGNISEDKFSLGEITSNPVFQKLGKISKDDIDICNSCEFRYMCIDSRIPSKHSESDSYYHDSECNYNPFIAKWKGETGYLNLLNCGIFVKKEKIEIDYILLRGKIEELYNLSFAENFT